MFSSKSVTVLAHIFRSLIYFELIWIYNRKGSNLVICMWISHCPHTICWWDCFFFYWMALVLLLRISWPEMYRFVLNCFSRVWLFATLGTVAHQAPLSMRFSRQEHWSGLPYHPARESFQPRDWTTSLMSSALAGGFFTTSTTW